MKSESGTRYFVARLDDRSFRPLPEAEFLVQVLNEDGEGEIIAYIARDSNSVVAVVHATKGRLPTEGHGIPDAVIEAARRRQVGSGEDVNEKGEIVQPSFLPP